ncbi:uncharacterized protein RJT21DRAFT_110922 [Scheffersomyces amazonensis]|uniref:uncharacterized protein n=1 Tax=Scheffersomyces amazonensis TaxID=1078765 RepID=UPI00315CBD5F
MVHRKSSVIQPTITNNSHKISTISTNNNSNKITTTTNNIEINGPDFDLTQYEISCIKALWTTLDIIYPGKSLSTISTRRSSISSFNSETSRTSLPITLSYNDFNYNRFKYILCENIYYATHSDHSFLENEYDIILSGFQVPEMIDLMAVMVDCLEYNRNLPLQYITRIAKFNQRVHNLESTDYQIFGDCLISTVISTMPDDSIMVLENQSSFNRFIAQLLNILVYYSKDAYLSDKYLTSLAVESIIITDGETFLPPPPLINSYSTNMSVSSSSASHYSAVSSVSSKQLSETSSQLSLFQSNEIDQESEVLEYDPSIKPILTSKTVISPTQSIETLNTINHDSNYTYNHTQEEDDENTADDFEMGDDSFDYLNSFGSDSSKKNKKKRASILKKSTPTPAMRRSTSTSSGTTLSSMASNKYSTTSTASKRMPSNVSSHPKKGVTAPNSIYSRPSGNGSSDNCVIM